ncbi:maleylpyruvate isomerase family mycothiol-dependent enzyme [Mycolicibacterium komossense]|uniref:Maleylpyruvate isomerase family mycothiol-dependent enzyme n=1 Tax=Mycolicibacterium komossense TaxID=1779 RepID=A0ABT3CG40_9MYCO|nr:maleylpyruvate isomerase family mycothiol-dependent enzyme [Mycolicibacterium komossense]MCV7228333.1 maleylpyruvate isomerase family mycothiol-dependent enzyme [Mycolicibacterium komossense]
MDYAAKLIDEHRIFADTVAAVDPAAPVPTCPGWTVQQLFRHVGRGVRWSAQMVADRATEGLDPRAVRDGKPPEDPEAATDWLMDGAAKLLEAVDTTGADIAVWTFLGPKPSAWWVRRRLHEVVVHRADAAIAAGTGFELAPALAADAISEWLDITTHPRPGAAPPLEAGQALHLHAHDEGLGSAGEWMITADADGALKWSHGHGKGSAAVRGRSVDLLLAITRRRPISELDVEMLGDDAVWQSWLDRTAF